jgi:hypothetical protein
MRTQQQQKSARAAQMVRQGSLRGTDIATGVDHLSPTDLAAVLVVEAGINEVTSSSMVANKVDSDLLGYLDDEGFKEAGVTSALDRARIRAWMDKHGIAKTKY